MSETAWSPVQWPFCLKITFVKKIVCIQNKFDMELDSVDNFKNFN